MEDTAACVLSFVHHCNCLLRLFASKLDSKYVCNVLKLDVCTLAGYVYDNI